MSVLLYGGGFNPPHLGHLAAADRAREAILPEHFLIIPDGTPPHKPLPEGSPDLDERLRLCRLAFQDRPWAEISELALRRDGPCYMIETVCAVEKLYQGEKLILLLGTDMLLSFDRWYCAEELMRRCTLAALCRTADEGERLHQKAQELQQRFGAEILLLQHQPVPVSSSSVRKLLPQRRGRAYLTEDCYREIIRCRLYHAKPELDWLQEQVDAMLDERRIPHVHGCAAEARRLALRWGIDPDEAQEAGILHDCTKRWTAEEQLSYCDSRGIVLDEGERRNPQLLHARTGAVAAREFFGATDQVCDAIRWHTTGKPQMTTFEKILYLADMSEPNRAFPGVEHLRALACEDLDQAMGEALRISVQSIRHRKMFVYQDTLEAFKWYCPGAPENKEESTC